MALVGNGEGGQHGLPRPSQGLHPARQCRGCDRYGQGSPSRSATGGSRDDKRSADVGESDAGLPPQRPGLWAYSVKSLLAFVSITLVLSEGARSLVAEVSSVSRNADSIPDWLADAGPGRLVAWLPQALYRYLAAWILACVSGLRDQVCWRFRDRAVAPAGLARLGHRPAASVQAGR